MPLSIFNNCKIAFVSVWKKRTAWRCSGKTVGIGPAVGVAAVALVLPSIGLAWLVRDHYAPTLAASLLADNIKYIATLPLLTAAIKGAKTALHRLGDA